MKHGDSDIGANAITIEVDQISTATTVQTEKTEETDFSSTTSLVSSRKTPSPTPVTVSVVGETKTKRDLGFLNKRMFVICDWHARVAIQPK